MSFVAKQFQRLANRIFLPALFLIRISKSYDFPEKPQEKCYCDDGTSEKLSFSLYN